MSAGKKIYQGIGIVVGASSFIGVFVLGYSAGRASTGEFRIDVEKAAKRRIREAADKVVKEQMEQRRMDRIFKNITESSTTSE
jgi:hypothetical protein